MRRALRQRGRVSESAFPQLQPGPRTHQPLVFLLEDGTVLPQLPQGPQQLQAGPVPEAHAQLALARERQGTGPQEPTRPSQRALSHHGPRRHADRKALPHIPGFQSRLRRSRRRGYLVLPAHAGTPDPGTLSGSPQFFPSLLTSSWEMPAQVPMPTPPGSMVPGSPPPKSTPSISHPPQTLSSLAQLNTEPPPLNPLSLHSDSTI